MWDGRVGVDRGREVGRRGYREVLVGGYRLVWWVVVGRYR